MSDDFRSTAAPETLVRRADLIRRTRAFFDSRGFVEVQTPLLSNDTVIDRHLDPVPVQLPRSATEMNSGRPMFLQTSPEFLMKRLLASGMQAIYQICPAFRVGESGQFHNPEFTMLEWYRCGDDYQAGMSLLSDFAAELLGRSPARIQTVQELFANQAGFNPYGATAQELRQRCRQADIPVPESIREDDWDSWFEILFGHFIQPQLGQQQPEIVCDYPATQAALARIRHQDSPVAERFELFVDGIELANGYHELLDADELRQRNETVNRQRRMDGKQALPSESRLVKAMEAGLPSCSGTAVGFDRLVMVAEGLSDIRQAISFPTSTA